MTRFFFNDTATTEIYTLSLHDALPISTTWAISSARRLRRARCSGSGTCGPSRLSRRWPPSRSEEHTSELQSLTNLVCRLLLEKKKQGLRLCHRHRSRPPPCAPYHALRC